MDTSSLRHNVGKLLRIRNAGHTCVTGTVLRVTPVYAKVLVDGLGARRFPHAWMHAQPCQHCQERSNG